MASEEVILILNESWMCRSGGKGKTQFAKDRNKTLSLALLPLKGTGGFEPIAQIDLSSKAIPLGPPGPTPADVLLMLPLNSVVKVLQGNGTVLEVSVLPAYKVTRRQECCCTLNRKMVLPRGWGNMEKI